ncbi:hypothetical protein [Deinococcus sp.]|uniref:hypothetical protein n=1 Tax=Deinococcus sp. TaxID=47478 RepID=UPI0025B842E3|nr:hypothetical protein [Deinococcus sp.]
MNYSQSRAIVAPSESGTGQTYPLFKVISGFYKGKQGYVHTSDIENVQDPAYRKTKTGELKLGAEVSMPHAVSTGRWVFL